MTRAEQAIERWSELACRNMTTDAKVNDLLEEIAGDKYLTSEQDDDPIWNTIQSLTDEELDAFEEGCYKIDFADRIRIDAI